MKKIISILLCFAMCFSILVSCGEKEIGSYRDQYDYEKKEIEEVSLNLYIICDESADNAITTIKREIILGNKDITREGVYLADVDDFLNPELKIFPLNRFFDSLHKNRIIKPWAKMVKELLNQFDGEKIERTTHECSLNHSHEQRFAMALDLLKKYATARCVITSRIHCALPCLALGTPVVLVTPTYDTLRYRGIDKFFNHIWMDENGKLSQHIDKVNGEIVNNNELALFINSLAILIFINVYATSLRSAVAKKSSITALFFV